MPEIELKVDGYECNRCKHQWIPKQKGSPKVPAVCPKCKSPYWNKPRKNKVKK